MLKAMFRTKINLKIGYKQYIMRPLLTSPLAND